MEKVSLILKLFNPKVSNSLDGAVQRIGLLLLSYFCFTILYIFVMALSIKIEDNWGGEGGKWKWDLKFKL